MEGNKKSVAIVLGGTIPHCELILKLRARGYYVILVDYLSDMPAKKFADEHIRESTLDREKVLEIAKKRNAVLVLSVCVDQANCTACYVMEKIGRRPPYGYETSLKVTDKTLMKSVMIENKIPTSAHIEVDKNFNFDTGSLKYPLITKPADSNSSNGVRFAKNPDELKKYFPVSLSASRNGKVVVEEYVSGREFSVYCFVKNYRAKIFLVAEKFSLTDEDGISGTRGLVTVAPAKISDEIYNRFENIATKIAKTFDLKCTPLFFQTILSGEKIRVLEFSPRVGGGISFRTIYKNTGFDILNSSIDAWEGKKVEVSFNHPSAPPRAYLNCLLYGREGVYDHIEGISELLDKKITDKIFLPRVKGDFLNNNFSGKSKVCYIPLEGETKKELICKLKKVYEIIDVKNPDGESLLVKNESFISRVAENCPVD